MPPGHHPGEVFFPSMPIQAETPGQARDMLDRLYLTWGKRQCSLRRAGGGGWGKAVQSLFAHGAVPETRTRIKRS